MTTLRFLGALWFLFSCYGTFSFCRNTLTFRPRRLTNAIFWRGVALAAFLNVLGLVASLDLFFGLTWARWLVSLLCIFQVLYYFSIMLAPPKKHPGIKDHLILAFALISLVLLIWPLPI
jgi:hypothetical protein